MPEHCPSCHTQVNPADRRCPNCGNRDLPAYAGDVQIRSLHVALAVVIHIALIAATYALLGWSLACAVVIVLLFLIFPKLTEACARLIG